ncbi:hypothetical protein ASD37_04475 [Mycobacterium sp. Root135]|uniref:hypothetical protein n=1 Tax=Mycobacterium sp. Root135 TaxID=1736457 RepID=UPI0006FD430D|nr:hypothetical protein [Mycobacterium sp. Root135]KQY10280.1 hypothetical protein ASD37_04475 [Mycobacterium sp. Root135]
MPTQSHSRSCADLGCIAAVAMLAVGCGEGPVLDSSNRGSGSHTTGTTVENAAIVPSFLDRRCAIQLNTGGELRLTITNSRPDATERFLGLSTSATTLGHVMAAVDVPPKSTVGIGQPSAQPTGPGSLPAIQLATLDPDLRPAMSADVTFHFQLAGDITMPVPIEACPTQVQ